MAHSMLRHKDNGSSPSGKAQDFDSCTRWFESSWPSYGRVAQVVEHLTFNQVVRGSNPRTLMQISKNFKGSCFFLYFYLILCIRDIRDKRRGNRSYELNNKKYK